MKYTECPECGTEILETEDCPSRGGTGEVIGRVVPLIATDCEDCNGTSKSNDYYCPHCDWKYEE